MNNTIRLLAAALLAVSVASCKKDAPPAPPPASAPAPAPAPAAPAPVSVSEALLGNAIGPDKKVTAASETFAPKDTIYATVATSGSGSATLKSKWTYIAKDGKSVPVKEESMQIQATGPAVNEFHVSKPDGWPAANYQVEILLNDQVVQTKKYSVK